MGTSEAVCENKDYSLGSNSPIVAEISKEGLKEMFYFFAGKPDSMYRTFNKRTVVNLYDIKDLHSKISSKLELHRIERSICSVSMIFDKEQAIDFKFWDAFIEYDWKTSYITKEIILRWDFLIQVDSFLVPQRHTLTVKISNPPSPQEFFKMMMTGDDTDLNEKLGFCIARVDFISHRLADELLNVVSEWNASLKLVLEDSAWFSNLEKHSRKIAKVIHYSIPTTIGLLVFFSVNWLSSRWTDSSSISKIVVPDALRWSIFSFFLIFFAIKIGYFVAKKVYRTIENYGIYVPFGLTRGDENKQIEIKAKNKKHIRKFIINTFIALLINIIAGIIIILM